MSLTGQCTGVLGAVALPVVGVGVGVAQIVRGVANTPEAIREQHKGKSWDQVTFYICPHEQVCTPCMHSKFCPCSHTRGTLLKGSQTTQPQLLKVLGCHVLLLLALMQSASSW